MKKGSIFDNSWCYFIWLYWDISYISNNHINWPEYITWDFNWHWNHSRNYLESYRINAPYEHMAEPAASSRSNSVKLSNLGEEMFISQREMYTYVKITKWGKICQNIIWCVLAYTVYLLKCSGFVSFKNLVVYCANQKYHLECVDILRTIIPDSLLLMTTYKKCSCRQVQGGRACAVYRFCTEYNILPAKLNPLDTFTDSCKFGHRAASPE